MVRSQAPGMKAQLSIGRLAAEGGVNVETIRYYQRRGLICAPVKPASGYRRYPPETLRRVRFIKRAQSLGFSLAEIAALLGLDEARDCVTTRDLAARKLEDVRSKLADLKAMQRALTSLVRQCDSGAAGGRCPIIHTLAAE